MPKGQSYKSDKYDSFEKGGYSFIEDDFVHDKTLVVKGKVEKESSGVNLKYSLSQKSEGLSAADEVKMWFNFNGDKSIFAKYSSNSPISIQYDNGVQNYQGINHNLYAAVQHNRKWGDLVGIAGYELSKPKNWSLGLRVRHDRNKNQFFIDDKINYLHQEWNANLYATYDIANKVLSKAGLLLAKNKTAQNPNAYYLRLENSKSNERSKLKELFENVTLNWVRSISSSQTIGLEAKTSLTNLSRIGNLRLGVFNEIWLGSEWKCCDSVLKAKINKNLTHAVSIKNKLQNYGTYSFGVEVSDVGVKNNFKFGIQLDLNL